MRKPKAAASPKAQLCKPQDNRQNESSGRPPPQPAALYSPSQPSRKPRERAGIHGKVKGTAAISPRYLYKARVTHMGRHFHLLQQNQAPSWALKG